MNTPQSVQKEVREEWRKEYHKPEGFVVAPTETELNTERIADWWLEKIDRISASVREETLKEALKVVGKRRVKIGENELAAKELHMSLLEIQIYNAVSDGFNEANEKAREALSALQKLSD